MDSKSRLAIADLILALETQAGPSDASVDTAQLAAHLAACLCPTDDPAHLWQILGGIFGQTRAKTIASRVAAGQTDGLVGDVAILRLRDGTGPDLLLAFDATALDRVVANGWPEARLTPAERRVLLTLMAGYDLPASAALDGVGTETRRSQWKSLATKLGLARQTDLLRQMTARLMVLIAAADAGVDSGAADRPTARAPPKTSGHPSGEHDRSDRLVRAFHAEIAPTRIEGLRSLVLHDGSATGLRVVDVGPRDGRPVIALHPQIFPLFGPADVAPFFRHGIRALWPIRPGALEAEGAPPVTFHPATQLAAVRQAIATLHDIFCDGPVTVAGMHTGAAFALDAAAQMPQRVGRVILVGAAPRIQLVGAGAAALRRGLLALARANPALLDRAMGMIRLAVPDPATFGRILRRHYRASPPDIAVIDHAEATGALPRVHHRHLASLGAMRCDFQIQAGFDWQAGVRIAQPLTFIHGATDPIQPAAALHAFLTAEGLAPPQIVPEAGQFLMFHHLDAVLSRTAAFIDATMRAG